MSGDPVTLVIPGRNCAATIRPCLEAVLSISKQPGSRLREIIFVDDASTDDTRRIVEGLKDVRLLASPGRGPGAARNAGWRAAASPLIWFIDSDCVAEPDALEKLLPHLNDPAVGGVGGSYGIMNPHSLLACLIHEEILSRHGRMKPDVNFLATFNVVYRRAVLERTGGFDPRYFKAQDAELAYRVLAAGHRLRFELASRVKHYHPTRLGAYLRTQRQQGHWRVWLHMTHRRHAAGDSYSGLLDHAQPPLAVLTAASLPLAFLPLARWAAPVPAALLLLAQLPLTLRIILRTRRPRDLLFAPLSFVRAFWRGAGMLQGMAHYFLRRRDTGTLG